jgi:hypothetical protein
MQCTEIATGLRAREKMAAAPRESDLGSEYGGGTFDLLLENPVTLSVSESVRETIMAPGFLSQPRKRSKENLRVAGIQSRIFIANEGH